VERIQFVSKAKRLGLSLEEIKGILQLHAREEVTCAHVRALLEAKLRQVDALVGELARLRDTAGTMEDCRPSGGQICGIIERGEVGASVQALAWLEAAHQRQVSRL